MEIRTTGKGLEVDRALDTHVRRRINFALSRFSSRVKRVDVRLAEEKESNGGMDKTCRIVVRLPGLRAVIVKQASTDPLTSVDVAADRAGRAVARRISVALSRGVPGAKA